MPDARARDDLRAARLRIAAREGVPSLVALLTTAVRDAAPIVDAAAPIGLPS